MKSHNLHSSPRTLLKRGITLIELTVIIVVLLSLFSLLFSGAQAWKRGSDRAGCILNIRNAQQALRSHQNLNNLNEGSTVDVSNELIGTGKYLESAPICPSSGSYAFSATIPPTGALGITCSLAGSHDHEPKTFDEW